MARGVRRVFPRARVTKMPLADGGEGTLDVLASIPGSLRKRRTVCGPLGSPVVAGFLIFKDRTALIEMAQAAGLTLVPPFRRNPRRATTYGVGELLLAARAAGCRRAIVTLGGSATVDGGAGMAQALGARLLDVCGRPIPLGGEGLLRLAAIEPGTLHKNIEGFRISGATDVGNPLLGPRGAARIFGPQKGATSRDIRLLEKGLANLARICRRDLGKEIAEIPGAGAAGGLGAGLIAFAKARLVGGAEWILRRLDFASRLRETDMLLTGEGSIDAQTSMGKLVSTVAANARRAGIPAIGFAGQVRLDRAAAAKMGLLSVYALADRKVSARRAMIEAAPLLERRVAESLRDYSLSAAGSRAARAVRIFSSAGLCSKARR